MQKIAISLGVLSLALVLLQAEAGYAQGIEEPTGVAGSIAYVGADFNVYTVDLAEDRQVQLTEDAGETRRYQWPTWSTDGRLAYFSLYLQDESVLMDAFISYDGHTDGDLVYTGPEFFNYAYWSPGNCSDTTACRDLAMLLSSPVRGMFVELIRDTDDGAENLTAGLGGPPFYYSWSPDGQRMLWQRNNERFDIYDAGKDRVVSTLTQTPGFILSPAWSPVDDRLLVGADGDNRTTDLMIVGDDDTRVLATGFTGLISSSWSPDGNYVAYREQSAQGYGPLIIVDTVTTETVARTPTTGVIAFFWSPNSRQVAYLTLAAPPGSFSAGGNHVAAQGKQPPAGIAWSVLEVESENVQQYGSFLPTNEVIYLLQYFDQFAQSHRVWSPDSRYLLYSEVTSTGPVINLLDTSQVGSVPVSVAEGVIGIWSFQ